VLGHNPSLSIVLFYDNFQAYAALPKDHGGHAFYLWFIDCLLQILAVLYLAALALTVARRFDIGPARFAAVLFTFACLTRFVAPAVFIPDFFADGVRPLSMLSFLPTTHLATFLLGALIAMAETPRQRAVVVAVLVAYAAATIPLFHSNQGIILLAAGMALLFFRRVALPRQLTAAVLMLSGASLFIYLTQFVGRKALSVLGLPHGPALDVAVALALGVGSWWGWTRINDIVARRLGRVGVPALQPAI
jgi:hypothetical protein